MLPATDEEFEFINGRNPPVSGMGTVAEAAGAGGEAVTPRRGVIPVQITIRFGDPAHRIGTIGVFQPDQPGAGVGHSAVAVIGEWPSRQDHGRQQTTKTDDEEQTQFNGGTSVMDMAS